MPEENKREEFFGRLRYWLMYKLKHGEIDVKEAAEIAKDVIDQREGLEEKMNVLLVDLEKEHPELAEINYSDKEKLNSLVNTLTVKLIVDLIGKGKTDEAIQFNEEIHQIRITTEDEFNNFKTQFFKKHKLK